MTETFDDTLARITDQLRAEKRISYRLLKRRFNLDDDEIEDVKDELIYAKRIADDEDDRVLVWRQQAAPADTDQAERRHLTVAFFDLADSTRISSALDPEDFREIILSYQRLVVSALLPYDGYIAQYLGDGVLVYFGYPSAREDDAQRGVEAALDVVEAFRKTAPTLKSRYGVEPAIRVGVHSGVVVLGGVGGESRTEQIAIGDAPNIAARLQAQAGPNEIVIGGDTYELVKYLFTFEHRGALQLKGIPQPVDAYSCTGRLSGRGRFQILVRKNLSSLHGRDAELGQLTDLWQRVQEGQSAVVLVQGEAGIGKTRLLLEASNKLVQDSQSRILMECSPFHQGTYLYPIVRYLHKRFGIAEQEDPESRKRKLFDHAAGFGFADDQWLALTGSLLGIEPDLLPPLSLSTQRQKVLTQDAVIKLLREDATVTRDLCIIDDLHWCDPSTLELLSRLVDEPVPGMLLAMTSRPEFQNPWPGITHIGLDNIPTDEAAHMVRSVDERGLLDDDMVREIVSRADGIPLFIEELTQTLLSEVQGAAPHAKPSAAHVPLTLQDSLFARLDRLSCGKEVAQLAAVIGRDFSSELLHDLWQGRSEDLQTGLHELTGARLLERQRDDNRTFYTFKHALVRDAAYESLLLRRREKLHRAVANAMEASFGDAAISQPEILAHHFTAGLDYPKAVEYWRLSGRRAQQRSAHIEAIRHLQNALDCLDRTDEVPNRNEVKLAILNLKGTSLIATKGYGSAKVGETYGEALEWSRNVGDKQLQFDTLQGLWAFRLVRGELVRALELAGELAKIAGRDNEPELVLEALLRQGISLSMLGRLTEARGMFEKVLALCDTQGPHSSSVRYGQDALVSCLCHYSLVLCVLGYPDQALARSKEARDLATQLAHPFTLSWALLYSALVRYLRREKAAASAVAEELARLCREQAFAYRLAQSRIVKGWAGEDPGAGAGDIRDALAAVKNTGALVFASFYYALLGEAELAGSPDSACTALDEGLQLTAGTNESIFRTELLRLKAHAVADRDGDSAAARDLLEEADHLARDQGARMELLRLAASRYLLDRSDAARKHLAACIDDVPEGMDLPDYINAVALLEIG